MDGATDDGQPMDRTDVQAQKAFETFSVAVVNAWTELTQE